MLIHSLRGGRNWRILVDKLYEGANEFCARGPVSFAPSYSLSTRMRQFLPPRRLCINMSGKCSRCDMVPSVAMPPAREGHMAIHIGRREFIVALGGAAAWPLAVRAQQPEQVRRIGVLMGFAENDPQAQAEITAFRQGLQRLGWAGRNIRIAYRWGQGEADRIRTVARELIALQPEAVLAVSTPAAKALLGETRTVPIVFVRVADPLGDGLVDSMASPSGNVTGFSIQELSLAGKWLQLLKEI